MQRQEESAEAHFRDLYYSLTAEHQKLSEGLVGPKVLMGRGCNADLIMASLPLCVPAHP